MNQVRTTDNNFKAKVQYKNFLLDGNLVNSPNMVFSPLFKLNRIMFILLSVLYVSGALTSCKDYLEVKPKDVLLPEQYYRDKYDADAAVRGIYGKFLNLASQYVILNELRADLMDVTENADYNLRQLNLHNASADNPYIDPQLFYSIINDCNDAMTNFNIMLKGLKFSEDEYAQRYSDIAALRSWLYMQLVIHFGKVPYITKPIDRVDDIKLIVNSGFPILTINQMVDSLINVMESLPYKDLYTDPTLRTNIDGLNTKIMFIDKLFFMGDLYLWKNNYLKAAECYKNIMERDIGYMSYDTYKISSYFYRGGYNRYYDYDINSETNQWPWMFAELQTSNYYCEWIWVLYFNSTYGNGNPFYDMFARKYFFKPSQLAIDNWGAQVKNNDFKGDFRGLSGSYYIINNLPVIVKYFYGNSSSGSSGSNGRWFLERAATLHLRFSEAANRDGHHKIAYALLNNGIAVTYNDDPGSSDLTYLQRTNLPFPYDFDGRYTVGSNKIPMNYRGAHNRNVGIRGRVSLKSIVIPANADSTLYLEDKLVEEAALELAYEGNRWGDLVRVAMRRNDPAFLADKIYAKLQKAGYPEAEAVRAKLMNMDNWFLPLRTN